MVFKLLDVRLSHLTKDYCDTDNMFKLLTCLN